MAYIKKPRNIYIVGSQSSGKTTLVKALDCHFDKSSQDERRVSRPKIITEVARTVLKKHEYTAYDITSSPTRALALQKLILEAQMLAERQALEDGEWFISDRSGFDPIVYARRYVSEEAADHLVESAEWLELRERMKDSLVIVCEAGADWLTSDGVRLMPKDREDWIAFHALFCRCLEEIKMEHEVLPCETTDIGERVAFVVSRWEAANEKLKLPNGT